MIWITTRIEGSELLLCNRFSFEMSVKSLDLLGSCDIFLSLTTADILLQNTSMSACKKKGNNFPPPLFCKM